MLLKFCDLSWILANFSDQDLIHSRGDQSVTAKRAKDSANDAKMQISARLGRVRRSSAVLRHFRVSFRGAEFGAMNLFLRFRQQTKSSPLVQRQLRQLDCTPGINAGADVDY